MRIVPWLAAIFTLAAVAGGCGSSDSGETMPTEPSQPAGGAPRGETPAPAGSVAKSCVGAGGAKGLVRATGVSCTKARAIAAEWRNTPRCTSPAGASRFSCAVSGYRCLGVATQLGIAVSCARPQRSIAFVGRLR
jgi:hypothetical protein